MKQLLGVSSFICLFLLSGCLYPENQLAKNQVPYKDQLNSVQTAVDEYQKAKGYPPIKERDMSTPIYRKYPVDFGKLVPAYIKQPPGTSYANGGVYSYVLVNVEKNPTVKLIDLRTVDKIQSLKLRLKIYISEHQYPPYKDVITNGVYTLDYEKLGYETPPYVVSPFSGKNLGFVINNQNEIFIDYSIDLYQALQNYDHNYKPGDDIRNILVKNSVFVPAYSLPYTIKNNEPVFLVK